MHIRQAPLNPIVIEGEILVIESQEMKNGGVEIVPRQFLENFSAGFDA